MRKHPPPYLLSLCLMMVRSAGICDHLFCAKDDWRVTILQRGKEGYNSFQVRTVSCLLSSHNCDCYHSLVIGPVFTASLSHWPCRRRVCFFRRRGVVPGAWQAPCQPARKFEA